MGKVDIKKVRKAYGGLEVLHGLDIPIQDGEFVVLVGPSGCGKSTLLRMIAGLEDITGGDIVIGDKRVNDLPPKERDVAMVFQNYALYPHMNVEQNMGFSLKLRRHSADEIKRKVADAAAILGMDKLLDRYPRQLSGGQRQRVAMGRAIVRNPEVFLFDEPLSNLDAKLRVQMRAEVKNLHQRLKTTTVYVTHDQIEAMTMADKIVVMLDGNIEQMGAPLDVYDRPASLFVAGFIGSPSMNFLAGQITADGFSAKGEEHLKLNRLPGVPAGTQAILGVRPEDLTICSPDTPNALRAKVVLLEPTGAETIVQTETAGGPVTALVRERVEARPGEVIGLAVPEDKAHFFDGSTANGKRLT